MLIKLRMMTRKEIREGTNCSGEYKWTSRFPIPSLQKLNMYKSLNNVQDRDRLRKKLGGIKTVRYIDPQRDCSVEIGERDIRREIMKHRGRLKNSMLADEADNPGFLLLLEQAERELRTSRPEVATVYLDK